MAIFYLFEKYAYQIHVVISNLMTNKVLRHVWVLLAEANFMNSSLNFPGISQTKLSPKSNNYAHTKDP